MEFNNVGWIIRWSVTEYDSELLSGKSRYHMWKRSPPLPLFFYLFTWLLKYKDTLGWGSMSHQTALSPFLTPPLINHLLLSSFSLLSRSFLFTFKFTFFLFFLLFFYFFLPFSFFSSPNSYPCSPPLPVTASSLGEQKVYGQWWSLSYCLAFSMIRLSLKSAEWD